MKTFFSYVQTFLFISVEISSLQLLILLWFQSSEHIFKGFLYWKPIYFILDGL